MKKFNANGGYRKDVKNDYNEHDLNNYSGQSLEDTKKSLDDTLLYGELSVEDLENVKAGFKLTQDEIENINKENTYNR